MNRFAIFFWLLVSAVTTRGQSISAVSTDSVSIGVVKDVQGQVIPLDSFPTKKLLIVILPATTDTALTGQLLRFQQRHGGQMNILGIVGPTAVPSPTVDSSSGSGYSSLQPAGVWLTPGMGAGDSATTIRQSVLQYISNKSRNRQVDHFAEGSKYFLSEKGRLFAQLGKNASLDGSIADYLVRTNVPGEERF